MTAPEYPGLGVFISYRREDVPGQAGRLYDRLSQRFGESRVFMDVDSIDIGVDFVAVLEAAVVSCEVMLVLIGPRWAPAPDVGGKSRLDDPYDYVRVEVETALERGVRVVPVLVQGASLPLAQQLPESVRPLVRRQALDLRDASFQADARLLIERLEPILGDVASGEPREASSVPPEAPAGRDPEASTSWQATYQRIGRSVFRLEVTLTQSSHIIELEARDLRANVLRVDGAAIPPSEDRILTERWEFSMADGPATRIGLFELQLGMFNPKRIVLTVDGNTLHSGL